MKAKIRVATDMYEFIELDVEGDQEEIWHEYQLLKKRATDKNQGLETKEWNACLDRYLRTNTMDSECYVRMSDSQRALIQEIKKSIKRIDNHEISKKEFNR